jgi:hypothetical protein
MRAILDFIIGFSTKDYWPAAGGWSRIDAPKSD